MPFCPNPQCPHIKKIGKPAEYVAGVSSCSDCGSKLTEKEIAIEREKRPTLSDFQKRLIYTLGMLALWRMLTHIAPPGINFEALDRFFRERGGEFVLTDLFGLSRITVLALGLMPYVTASVAVEILALFLKPLKSWRESGYQEGLNSGELPFLQRCFSLLSRAMGSLRDLQAWMRGVSSTILA